MKWLIFLGAYLGIERAILSSGKLSEVADKIEQARTDGKERYGWLMDTYLLRKQNATDAT